MLISPKKKEMMKKEETNCQSITSENHLCTFPPFPFLLLMVERMEHVAFRVFLLSLPP